MKDLLLYIRLWHRDMGCAFSAGDVVRSVRAQALPLDGARIA